MDFSFIAPPRLLCAPGASAQLADLCKDLGVQRPLIITDAGLAAAGHVTPVEAALAAQGLAVQRFQDVVADPPEAVIEAALACAQQHRSDGIIGLGGGSAMDTAKLVALLAASPQPLTQVYGVGNAQGKRLPLIQVPTTAGTGSEATPIAIVTTGTSTKSGVVAPQLMPDVAVLDARLTLGLPPAVTAATGIDAMVHAIEATTSRLRHNPLSDLLASEALRLLCGQLETAVADGSNENARGAMLLGAYLAGQAFANAPVAAVHALAYPLGGIYHLPHGLSNALVLPAVLEFNLPAAETEYNRLAPIILGRPGTGAELPDHFRALSQRVGLPTRLRDLDIPATALPQLAEEAMLQQRLLVNNPRAVAVADALALYQAVW
ncbi:iron-containing alcohol dehydrogenase [Isoalcanivorax beigongshangi]|uniref:Iron-containing alcohol dehydrogenase n=1 Tax=Isoalcanivorax beigongshangi TaxID=3238810 RepID=A0ABV4AKP5_9GAMM